MMVAQRASTGEPRFLEDRARYPKNSAIPAMTISSRIG
jgi:hypothetical protein